MNKRDVEKFLPNALAIVSNKKAKVDSQTRSKLSAFGATVIMSGLLPAVAGFSKSQHKQAIELISNLIEQLRNNKLIEEEYSLAGTSLLEKVKNDSGNEELKELIINCDIALKLALDAVIEREDKNE